HARGGRPNRPGHDGAVNRLAEESHPVLPGSSARRHGDRRDHGCRVSGGLSHVHAKKWILRRTSAACRTAIERHGEADRLFPIGRQNVGDLQAESLELLGLERLGGKHHVHGLHHRLLPGVEPLAAVRGEREGRFCPRSVELDRLPLIVEVLELSCHQKHSLHWWGMCQRERINQTICRLTCMINSIKDDDMYHYNKRNCTYARIKR